LAPSPVRAADGVVVVVSVAVTVVVAVAGAHHTPHNATGHWQ